MLNDSVIFGSKTVKNRVVCHPMEGCDCLGDGTPSDWTRNKYLSLARSGAGIIWGEANAVCPEGRTSTRQMMITEKNVSVFGNFVSEIKRAGKEANGFEPIVFIQLTHSGRQSIVPMIAYRHPIYEKTRPVGDGNIVSDEYLDSLPALFAKSAMLAKEAGFDGVDVKSCHGYLMQELLSAFLRGGRYGGSFENRTKLYISCVKAVKAAVGDGYTVVTRLGISDVIPKPYGFGTDEHGNVELEEPKKLIALLQSEGIGMINVTLGNPYYNPHVNRPFRAGGYVPPEKPEKGLDRFVEVEREIKSAFPKILLVGTGLSYYRGDLMEQAEKQLSDGICDLVGFGRETLAYPLFYKDWLEGKFDAKKTCVACSKCTELMRHGAFAGCAVHNPAYKELYREKVVCKK